MKWKNESEKELISIRKIVHDDIKSSVLQALSDIHAEQLFSKQNMKILIKPNVLNAKEPSLAVTTHPDIIRAVIQWVKKFAPSKIFVCDSSGGRSPGMTDIAFKKSGIFEMCSSEGVDCISFEKTVRQNYTVSNPLILPSLISSKLIQEADLIINLPKIKTHSLCMLTCSIKNMFGLLILGNKASIHAKYPLLEDFSKALVDIYSIAKPQLTIIDGYLCQEGNGPSNGDVVKLDLILAGYDPVALDTVVCNIINISPKKVLYLKFAEIAKLGCGDLSKIHVIGESINSIKHPFKMPHNLKVSLRIPHKISQYLGNIILAGTIRFNLSKCSSCGTCWENCPAHAITPMKFQDLKNNKMKPQWNKKNCISCYCCAELCPNNAVDFKINVIKNLLMSWFGLIGLFILIVVILLYIIFL